MPTGTVMHEDNRSSRLRHNKRQRASRCREKRPTSRARTGWLTVYRLSIRPGWRTKATCRWMAETLPVKMLIRGAHRGKARTTDNTYPRRTIRSNFQQAVNAQLRFLSGWSKGNVVNGEWRSSKGFSYLKHWTIYSKLLLSFRLRFIPTTIFDKTFM